MGDGDYQRINDMIEDTKDIVVDTVTKTLERGNTIDILRNDSETLERNSIDFNRSSHALKKEMIWRKIKMALVILGGVLLLILIGLLIVCDGFVTNKCK